MAKVIWGVYRRALVLIDGSTTETKEVVDLMHYRMTKREADKLATEWNAEAKQANSSSTYYVKKLDN